MRVTALMLVGLAGCGEVVGVIPDAPPEVVIDAADAAIDAPPDAPPAVPRLYTISKAFQDNGIATLEVIDLRTSTKIVALDLPPSTPTSFVVSADGGTAYIGDVATGQIRTIDTRTGVQGLPFPVAAVRDLVMTADGGTLYAAAGDTVAKIDLATRVVTTSAALGQTVYAIALAPGEARLALIGGGNVLLVRASDVSLEASLPMTPSGASNCLAQPFAVAFKGNDRVLTWDSNCDELYQIDPNTRTQLVASTIVTGRDSGAGGQPTSRLALSAATGLAYAVREDGQIAVINADTKTFLLVGGFGGTPMAIGASTTGDRMFVPVFQPSGGADQLAVYDTTNSQLQTGAYVFSPTTLHVVDTAMIVAP